MNLAQLQSANTLKAKAIAESVFKRFLEEAHVDMAVVAAHVRADSTGAILVSLMDRFGVYLAFQEGKNGQKLAHNTVMQYFRQAKLWLLGLFPQSSAHVEAALLKKSGLLDRYCKTRPERSMVKQASGCTKADLYSLMRYLYATASSPADYQDVALLAMLWYLFGRASDLTLLRKQNLSMCGGNVLFVRFVRVKTSQENGLSLFPDACAVTCPITAIAAALALQSTPSDYLLPHLPAPTSADITALGPLVPLADVLAGMTAELDLLEISDAHTTQQAKGRKAAAPGIHSYVNRLLTRIAGPAGVVTALTSHSFRRGGAQAANGCPDLTLQWIADRGGWSMSSTNKAFQYIFNTTQEDQKVSKVLSGWDSKAAVPVMTLDVFDSLTREKLEAVKATLFSACSGLQAAHLNVSPAVTDVLCAYLVKAFPELKALQPGSPLVRRVEGALRDAQVPYEELLAWAVHLAQKVGTSEEVEKKLKPQDVALLKAQSAVLDEMVGVTKMLSLRLQEVEAQLEGAPKKRKRDSTVGLDASREFTMVSPAKKKRTQSRSVRLNDVWYAWYANRTYALPEPEKDAKKLHEVRKVVSFMRLFAGSYELDDSADDFRDRVLSVGSEAAAAIELLFAAKGVSARSSGTALKEFRKMHQAGELDHLINDFKLRVASGLISDPTPMHQRCVLAPVEAYSTR